MTTLARLTRIAAKAAHRKDTLLIERGIGYWITDGGEYLPTPPRVSHADLIREWFDEETLSEDEQDAMTRDANAFVIARGWTRVRIYPSNRTAYVDFGAGKQAAHRKFVDDLLDQLGLVGLTVKYTDEQGNYVSP